MKKIPYRNNAKRHFSEAVSLLTQDDTDSIIYAALRLRMVMECLAYEILQSMMDDLVGQEIKTWQPGKLMKRLKEIDPTIEASRTISVGLEETPGERAEKMECLGTDRRLAGSWITKHWNALGSHLHEPTMDQLEKGVRFDDSVKKEKLTQIKDEIGEVLKSQLFAVNIRETYSFDCECGAKISRGNDALKEFKTITCPSCERVWSAEPVDEGWRIIKLFYDITCPSCCHMNKYEAELIGEDRIYVCKACDEKFNLVKDWCPRLLVD